MTGSSPLRRVPDSFSVPSPSSTVYQVMTRARNWFDVGHYRRKFTAFVFYRSLSSQFLPLLRLSPSTRLDSGSRELGYSYAPKCFSAIKIYLHFGPPRVVSRQKIIMHCASTCAFSKLIIATLRPLLLRRRLTRCV